MSTEDPDYWLRLTRAGGDPSQWNSSSNANSVLNGYNSSSGLYRPRKRALSEEHWRALQGGPEFCNPCSVGTTPVPGAHLQSSMLARERLEQGAMPRVAGARGQDATAAAWALPPQCVASAAGGLFQGTTAAAMRAQGLDAISVALAPAQGATPGPWGVTSATERVQQTLAELEQQLLGDGDDDNSVEPILSVVRPQKEALEELLSGSPPPKSTLSVERQALNSDRSVDDSHSSPNSYAPSQRKLLMACASAVSENDFESAEALLAELSPMASLYGDHMQRLTAYFSQALRSRIRRQSKQGQDSLTSPPFPPPSKSIVGMQALYRAAHYKFGYMAANSAIIEALKGEDKVHILDFDIGHGTQWVAMIRAFAARPGGPPQLRITGVAGPQLLAYKGGVQFLGKRLEDFAKTLNMQFEFCALEMEAAEVRESMIERRAGEALAVNMAFQLHRVPDESVSVANPRDRLLRMVHALGPRVVTLVELEANTNSAPFLPRFTEALDKYAALFESFHMPPPSLPSQRESNTDDDPANIEDNCLARSILSTVACEGAERIERYEWFTKWRARMGMAGFHLWPLSPFITNTIKSLVHKYQGKYFLTEEGGALHLGWNNTVLVVASAWKA